MTLSSAWGYGLVSSFTATNFTEQLSVPTDSITALSVHISPGAGCLPLSSITQQKGVSIRSQMDLRVDKSNGHFAALILLDFSAALDTGWPLSPWMLSSLGFPDTKLPSSISWLFFFYFLCRQALLSMKCRAPLDSVLGPWLILRPSLIHSLVDCLLLLNDTMQNSPEVQSFIVNCAPNTSNSLSWRHLQHIPSRPELTIFPIELHLMFQIFWEVPPAH